MAIPLAAIQVSNASLTSSFKSKSGTESRLVALFVGGTSGIGQTTLRSIVKYVPNSKIYVVGRNEGAVRKMEEDLDIKIEFLKADVSLLREVDFVCDIIRGKETVLHILCLSQGIVSMAGRTPTTEGLDQKLCLHYYSRMRFIDNLVPLLKAGSASELQLSRVVSVLTAGRESDSLILDDLDLKNNFSLGNCMRHAVTMGTLMMENYAEKNSGTSFVHASPGIVATPLGSHLDMPYRIGYKAIAFLAKPWSVDIVESGERHLFAATSAIYPPRDEAGAVVPEDSGLVVAQGSDGAPGSGMYLIDWDGEVKTGSREVLQRHRKSGAKQKVWEHTLGVFHEIEAHGKYYIELYTGERTD